MTYKQEQHKGASASARWDRFNKSSSEPSSFIWHAPRNSNSLELCDYGILSRSRTTRTITIQIEVWRNASHVVAKSQSKMSGDSNSNSRILFPPLILHLSCIEHMLAAKRLGAMETGKGDSELDVPPKNRRSKRQHDQSTLSSIFRSISFNDVSRCSSHYTRRPSHDSWEWARMVHILRTAPAGERMTSILNRRGFSPALPRFGI